MRSCVYGRKAEVSAFTRAYACVVSSLCSVYFTLPAHSASRPQHWSSCLNTGGVSVDQWSRISTSAVVEQVAFIAAVMNVTSVHSLQRTTPQPSFLSGINPLLVHSPPNHLQVAFTNLACVGEADDSAQSTSLTQSGVRE